MEATIVEGENLEIESGNREAATYQWLSKLSVDDALKILTHNAIKEFGYAPRDMCRAIFNPESVRWDHDAALRDLSFQGLRDFVDQYKDNGQLETRTSHRILQVYPVPRNVDQPKDDWTIDFKSEDIKEKVFLKMQTTEDQHVRDTYRLYHNNPIASALARSLFELIVHKMLTLGCRSDRVTPELQPKPPICMSTKATSAADAPIFTTDPPSTSFSTPDSLLR